MTQALQRDIDEIVSQLVTHYKPEKIILFGSAARGDMNEDSDLDFFVIKSDVPKVGRDRYYDMANRIRWNFASDFLICTPKEVQTRLALGDPFMKSIISEGKVLYGE